MYNEDGITPVIVSRPLNINNSDATISQHVDTFGNAGGLVILICGFGSVNTTGIDILRVEETDVDPASASDSDFSTIAGCDALSDTQADGSAKITYDADSDNCATTFYIPLTGQRKRYMRIAFSNGASGNCNFCCMGLILGEGGHGTPSATALAGSDGAIFRAVTT